MTNFILRYFNCYWMTKMYFQYTQWLKIHWDFGKGTKRWRGHFTQDTLYACQYICLLLQKKRTGNPSQIRNCAGKCELTCPPTNSLICCFGVELQEGKISKLHGTALLLSNCCSLCNIPSKEKRCKKCSVYPIIQRYHIQSLYCHYLEWDLEHLSLHSLSQSLCMAANQVQEYPCHSYAEHHRGTGIPLMD